MVLTQRSLLVLLIAVSLQVVFWYHTRTIRPALDIVPPLPTERMVAAESLGDKQLYFRYLALQLQSMGDTFGRITPLQNYDYKLLQQWFFLLDRLDNQSHFVPSIASYYFSQTQYPPDVRYITEYLIKRAEQDPQRNWWWLTQATLLANHRLKDKRYALEIAKRLTDIPGTIPLWARQMPAFIHEQLGEAEEALAIIKLLLDNYKDMPETERNFINYFIHDRLEKILPSQKGK